MGESDGVDGVAAGVADSAMSKEPVNEPTFGFSSEEIADLRKEFDAADVGGTGVLNKAQLLDLLFKRLFYSRPDNVGNKVDRIFQRTAFLQARSTEGSPVGALSRDGSAEGTAKNPTPGGTAQGDLPSEEAHALVLDGAGAANRQSKDSLTGEGVNGAVRKIQTSGPLGRQKAVTPTNEAGDVGSGGEAARRKAAAKRRHSLPVTNLEGGGAWGVPDPTVQDRFRRRRPSFVATDAPLKMLPKEYVEDTATARMLAKQAFAMNEEGAKTIEWSMFLKWNATVVEQSESSRKANNLTTPKNWEGILTVTEGVTYEEAHPEPSKDVFVKPAKSPGSPFEIIFSKFKKMWS